MLSKFLGCWPCVHFMFMFLAQNLGLNLVSMFYVCGLNPVVQIWKWPWLFQIFSVAQICHNVNHSTFFMLTRLLRVPAPTPGHCSRHKQTISADVLAMLLANPDTILQASKKPMSNSAAAPTFVSNFAQGGSNGIVPSWGDCSILRLLFHLEVISELVSEPSESELQASKHKQELLQVQGPLFTLQSVWESKCMEGLLQGLEFPQAVLVLLELTMLLVPPALQHPVLTWLQLHLGVSHWFVGAKLLPTQLLSTFSAISMCHEISFMVWNVFQCLPMEDLPYVWQGISIPNLLMGQEQKKEQSLAEGGFAMLASKMMLLDQELQEMPAKRTSRFWLPRTGCAHFQLWCKENCKWDLSILPLYVNNIGQSKMLMAGMASGPTECRTISFTNGLKPEGSSRLKSTWKGT